MYFVYFWIRIDGFFVVILNDYYLKLIGAAIYGDQKDALLCLVEFFLKPVDDTSMFGLVQRRIDEKKTHRYGYFVRVEYKVNQRLYFQFIKSLIKYSNINKVLF